MSVTGFNRRRRQAEKEREVEKEIDYEKVVEQYHKGRGWYQLPNEENSLRKEEAIELLKEGD